MINAVLKLSEIKKDPTCLLGWDKKPAMITRYGDVVAYVVSPERMEQLIEAEQRFAHAKDLIEAVKQGRLIAEDL